MKSHMAIQFDYLHLTKAMHISIVNISQTVKDSAIKYEVIYGLSISIFIFDLVNSKGQRQGHAHFN